MPYLPLDIPPGVAANGTAYENKGRWHRANLVRWNNGVMGPVGGWEQIEQVQFQGICRSLHAWRDNAAQRYLAVGTTTHLYVYSDRGNLVDISPSDLLEGRVDAIYGLGYGAADYSDDTYGTPRPGNTRILLASTWSFDAFGEDLIAVSYADGRILRWTPDLSADPIVKAAPLANAPVQNTGAFVTPERHVIALGAGGVPSLIKWSDREDPTVWTPAATNLAGDFTLQTDGRIYTALRLRGETLILTSADAHTMRFVGSPFVYGFELAGQSCGAASPMSPLALDDFAVWMGNDGWYIYNGVVEPLPSEVEGYVFGDINRQQLSKVVGGVNQDFNEAWWLYPSAGSSEVDRYVIWNYVENHWTIGELPRTAFAAADVFRNPILASAEGYLYRHEEGWTADGTPIETDRYALSAPIELSRGDRFAVVTKVLPDENSLGATQVSFDIQNTPTSAVTTKGPYTPASYTDTRFTARQLQMRVEGVSDERWRVGVHRLEVRPGSRR